MGHDTNIKNVHSFVLSKKVILIAMMMKKGCGGHMIAGLLVIIGALNWGLVGAFEWNLVDWLLGSWPVVVRIVYVLVGLAGILLLVGCKCKKCKEGACKNCKMN